MSSIPKSYQIHTRSKRFKTSLLGYTPSQLSSLILDASDLATLNRYCADAVCSGYYDMLWHTIFIYLLQFCADKYYLYERLLTEYRNMNLLKRSTTDIRNNQQIRNKVSQIATTLLLERTDSKLPGTSAQINFTESVTKQYIDMVQDCYVDVDPSSSLSRWYMEIFSDWKSAFDSILNVTKNVAEECMNFPGLIPKNAHPIWMVWFYIFNNNRHDRLEDKTLDSMYQVFRYLLIRSDYVYASHAVYRALGYIKSTVVSDFAIPTTHCDLLEQGIVINLQYASLLPSVVKFTTENHIDIMLDHNKLEPCRKNRELKKNPAEDTQRSSNNITVRISRK